MASVLVCQRSDTYGNIWTGFLIFSRPALLSECLAFRGAVVESETTQRE